MIFEMNSIITEKNILNNYANSGIAIFKKKFK